MLISNGADVNARDRYGDTLLLIALSQCFDNTARLLISKGADVNYKDRNGRSYLDLTDNKDMIESIRQHQSNK